MKFRKKPVVIEAVQWNGKNVEEIRRFVGKKKVQLNGQNLVIPTLEGKMTASAGDWIIRGVHGEVYPCKPDIFQKTYESVE